MDSQIFIFSLSELNNGHLKTVLSKMQALARIRVLALGFSKERGQDFHLLISFQMQQLMDVLHRQKVFIINLIKVR